MMTSPSEARRKNRELGLKPGPGQTHQEVGSVHVTEEMHAAVCVFARKLAKAIFFRETGKIFPDEGCLLLNWFSNSDYIREGKYPVFEMMKEIGGNVPPLQRTGKYLNDQFEYKFTLAPDGAMTALQARFGNAFGFVVFGSCLPGRLEAIVVRLREKTSHDGPFAILQSPSLA